jgi:hypothetical protein
MKIVGSFSRGVLPKRVIPTILIEIHPSSGNHHIFILNCLDIEDLSA